MRIARLRRDIGHWRGTQLIIALLGRAALRSNGADDGDIVPFVPLFEGGHRFILCIVIHRTRLSVF